MAAPAKNGRYLARVTSIVLQSKDTGSVQAQLDFDCESYISGTTPEPCHDERCREWFTIINKDGKPNDINVNQLREALGWEGSFSELTALDLTDMVVQIVIEDKTSNNGKTYKCVKYLNPKDYTGRGPEKTSEATVMDLEARYGALLRATAKPVANGTPTKTKPAPATSAPANQGKDLAYREMQLKVQQFNSENPLDPIPESKVQESFIKLFKSHFGETKKGVDVSAGEWAAFRDHIKKQWSPAILDEIPF